MSVFRTAVSRSMSRQRSTSVADSGDPRPPAASEATPRPTSGARPQSMAARSTIGQARSGFDTRCARRCPVPADGGRAAVSTRRCSSRIGFVTRVARKGAVGRP